jgi:hypothetical protein
MIPEMKMYASVGSFQPQVKREINDYSVTEKHTQVRNFFAGSDLENWTMSA